MRVREAAQWPWLLALSLHLAAAPWSLAGAAELVVLDPGHGGHLPGAFNPDGIPEKRIVLNIAHHARRALEASGIRVLMTRTDDQHVDLGERIQRANQSGAAVFVSIHGNYSPVAARRGVETYVLAVVASDESSLALAHLENDGDWSGRFYDEDAFGGMGSEGAQGDLEHILADLRRTVAHQESGTLALSIQTALGRLEGFGPSRGLRQAPFRVLKGARMPAVLVEAGYMSHARQGVFLATAKAEEAAGEAIARGIRNFLRKRRAEAVR